MTIELPKVPEYVAGLKVIGTVAVYKSINGKPKLVGCFKDVIDAKEISDVMETETFFEGVDDGDSYAYKQSA